MKRIYLTPEQTIIDLQGSGVICGSFDEQDGRLTDYVYDDDTDFF